MLDELGALVEAESPTDDVDACARCAGVLAEIGMARLGAAPERVDGSLLWRFGEPTRVLLVGHLDTVWPLGTLAEMPFAVRDGRATGPGVFDMKAGLVQGLHALASLDSLDGITLLVTSDEETGSRRSRSLIEDEARGARAALVLEPSADGGALKIGRKGVSMYTLRVRGRAAHAGLEPENGVNALIELSHQVLVLAGIARSDLGTSVTPTVATAGSATNVVPEVAIVHIDVRCASREEQQRVDEAMRSLPPVLDGAEVVITGGPNRPPMPESSAAALFERAQQIDPTLRGVVVGGGSDGNFTAGVGTPTLDGLGAVGGGAHARDEWIDVGAMAERARLVAQLITRIREP